MKRIVLAGGGIVALCIIIITLWLVSILSNLPDVSVLKHYRPAIAAEVRDKDGAVLVHYFDRKYRIWAPISGLPDVLIQAVVTAEDDTFFGHKGVNYKAVWDALVHDVNKRRFSRGGSTITQQMIKNVLLSKEKTIVRKVREYVLSRKAEELLTKRQILEIYLNEVEWGENIYGIEAASRFYLDKHASDLSAAEAALLAGMLPNPRYYNPNKRPDKARDRQERVLFNMAQARLLTSEEYESALHAPLKLRQEGAGQFDFSELSGKTGRPCYQTVLEQVLLRMYGDQALYRSGRAIRTTLDKQLQDEVVRAETAADSAGSERSEAVAVIRQGNAIRAILCRVSDDPAMKGIIERLGSGYSMGEASVDSIGNSDIVLP